MHKYTYALVALLLMSAGSGFAIEKHDVDWYVAFMIWVTGLWTPITIDLYARAKH